LEELEKYGKEKNMIQCLRIDDRFLHGQVITKWLTIYNPDAIVIADDKMVDDAISKMALRVAKPEGMKLTIRNIEDAIELMKNERTQQMKLFVLVKTTESARKLVEAGLEIDCVNIGGIRNTSKDAKVLAGVVRVTGEDINNLKAIANKVREIDIRTVPSEKKVDVIKLINN